MNFLLPFLLGVPIIEEGAVYHYISIHYSMLKLQIILYEYPVLFSKILDRIICNYINE